MEHTTRPTNIEWMKFCTPAQLKETPANRTRRQFSRTLNPTLYLTLRIKNTSYDICPSEDTYRIWYETPSAERKLLKIIEVHAAKDEPYKNLVVELDLKSMFSEEKPVHEATVTAEYKTDEGWHTAHSESLTILDVTEKDIASTSMELYPDHGTDSYDPADTLMLNGVISVLISDFSIIQSLTGIAEAELRIENRNTNEKMFKGIVNLRRSQTNEDTLKPMLTGSTPFGWNFEYNGPITLRNHDAEKNASPEESDAILSIWGIDIAICHLNFSGTEDIKEKPKTGNYAIPPGETGLWFEHTGLLLEDTGLWRHCETIYARFKIIDMEFFKKHINGQITCEIYDAKGEPADFAKCCSIVEGDDMLLLAHFPDFGEYRDKGTYPAYMVWYEPDDESEDGLKPHRLPSAGFEIS